MYQQPSYGPLTTSTSTTIPSDTMQKVEIYLSARNLLDKDFFSKSDPYIKLYFKRDPSHKETYVGRTETINNNLNPNFNTAFKLDYVFEIHQELRFEIFDYDNGIEDDFLGEVKCSLGAVAGAKSQTLICDIKNSKANNSKGTVNNGKLIIRMQTFQQSNIYLSMKWRASKLMNTDSYFDFWDKSDPYLRFIKIRPDNSFIEVFRTEVIQNNLNPSWKPLEICLNKLVPAQRLNQGRFKIQCWDWEQDGDSKHQFIGQVYVDYNKIRQNKSVSMEFVLTNPKKKNVGKLICQNFVQTIRPGFMDYLKGGLQLNLSIAIDFTGSNGIPTHPNSLHYINPMQPNQYQQAIYAVSRILLNYDTDKRIPCFAFGGKPHFPNFNSNMVNHCFPLSGDSMNYQAYGVQHLMELYTKALNCIELAGPTYFSGIINQIIQLAQKNCSQGSNTYQILLILTDGQIHDMQKVIDLLVQYCNLPLSLIIVGVGNADFDNMNTLDGDNGLYSSKGQKAYRDITQFVPFRNVGMNSDLLAQELLAQLPNQVVQYMRFINKLPNPPLQINIQNMIKNDPNGKQINPQQAMEKQVTDLFQKANFFSDV